MSNRIRSLPLVFSLHAALVFASAVDAATGGPAALIREDISINGGVVEGDIHLVAPRPFNINSGFRGEGRLLLPGTPDLQIHPGATVLSIVDDAGDSSPHGYRARINGGAFLEAIRTRVDPPEFPEIAAPPSPSGNRNIRLGRGDSFDGDFSTIRNLTLANGADPFFLPPGSYGELHVQRDARLVLGHGGEDGTARYTFTRIQWHAGAVLELTGPVTIEAGSFPGGLTGVLGDPERPEWLTLGVATGGVNLNSHAEFHGTLLAPEGRVILNANSLLSGRLVARDFTLNSNARLRFSGGPEVPLNQPPVAGDASFSVVRYDVLTASVALHASDPDGDPLLFEVVADPQNGALEMGGDGTFTYIPAHGFFGEDRFTYRVFDGELFSGDGEVIVVVHFFNHLPVAEPMEVFTHEGETVDLMLAATDADGDPLSFQVVEVPQSGSLAGEAPNVSYTPQPGFYGVDRFRFVAADGYGTSESATVTIEVNARPSVEIMHPANSAVFPQSISVEIAAFADDSDGTVERVEFFAGDEWLGESVEAPFVFQWDGATAGIHSLRAIATDDRGATGTSDVVTIMIRDRMPPRVDAGPDRVLDEPGTVLLHGSGEGAGESLSFRWRIIGENSDRVRFDDPTQAEAVATFDEPGEYLLRLSAFDGEMIGFDEMRVTVHRWNRAPEVSAGDGFSMIEGRTVALDGTISDDGLPTGALLTSLWSVSEGDVGAVTFGDSSDPKTDVRIMLPGNYRLRLTAFDGELAAHDDVEVQVETVPNLPPMVDAGPDQHLPFHTQARLFGSVEDDGLPLDGALSYQWIQTGGPAAIIEDPESLATTVTFNEPGVHRFRLLATDGELEAFDETVIEVELINQPPVVDAGPDLINSGGLVILLEGTVTDDGLPLDGALAVEWSQTSGPGSAVFHHPDRLRSAVEVDLPGEYRFRLSAYDGELEGFDEVNVRFGSPVNHPPMVDAGPDQTVDFNLLRTANLLENGGAETPFEEGAVPGWEAIGAVWQRVLGGHSGVPEASEGEYVFRAPASGIAEMRQEIDVSPFAETIDEGSQLFELSLSYRVADKVRYDEPRIRVEYRTEGGETLAYSDISPTPVTESWGFLADTRVAPAGTRQIRVRLLAYRSGIDLENEVYYDEVSLRGVRLPPLHLLGSVEDDGLPEGGVLTTEWRTIRGPVAPIFENPADLRGRVYFSAAGEYELELRADDGEMVGTDRMIVTVVDSSGGGMDPLQVNAGPDLFTELPLAIVLPIGSVGGGGEETIQVSWAEVSGRARIFIGDANTLTPEVRFYETGEYTLRLSVREGDRVAFDEMRVTVACPEELQPLDVVMVIDKSGSMAGERMINARLAAQQFIERMVPGDRAAVVPFDVGASVTMPLTSNHAAAIAAVQTINAGGGTSIHAGINVAANELIANGRPEAEWVILLLSDGISNRAAAITAAQAAHASGMRIISVGLGSGTDEYLMLASASSRADYFFADTGADLEPIYDGLSRSFCRFVPGLEVFAGGTLHLPRADAPVVLAGRISTRHVPPNADISVLWEVVSGPGGVTFVDEYSPITEATFAVPGVYRLSLTGKIQGESGLLVRRAGMLTVTVDQPSDAIAPAGLVALWRGEWNVMDSVGGFHGRPTDRVFYGDGPVNQGFIFGPETRAVEVPTEGRLNVGQSPDGFSVEFWGRVDHSVGTHRFFGWYLPNGNTQFSFGKVAAGNRNMRIYWRDDAGNVLTFDTPDLSYRHAEWHHWALVYTRSSGVLRVFRDGLHWMAISGLGNSGVSTDGDFFFGGHPNGGVLHGSMDELAIYDRPLRLEEIWQVARPEPKILTAANSPPTVDAGPDQALHSIEDIAILRGFVADDGLPSGGGVRTKWRKLSGPGNVLFENHLELETAARFSEAGVYVLELSADDGVAISRATMRVLLGVAAPTEAQISGLQAYWPLDGHGREEVRGLHAESVGKVSFGPGVIGEALQGPDGYLVARTGRTLNVGESPDGFTVEFNGRLTFTVGNQILTAWYADTRLEFAILKVGDSSNSLRVRWRDADNVTHFLDTNSGAFSPNSWHYFTFVYDPTTGRLRIYRDGTHFQTLNLSEGGFPTTGDFWMGGRSPFTETLIGSLDEVGVFDRQLSPEEIWLRAEARAKGKAVVGTRLPPLVDAGDDLALNSVDQEGVLLGSASSRDADTDLRVRWRRVAGPGAVTFGDASQPETTVQFAAPGIYTLELSANDGWSVATDTVRVVVGWADGALFPPAGLRAHWPGEGDGREVVNGFDAEAVGPVTFRAGVVGQAFDFSNSALVARTAGELNVGESPDGFTVEFWSWISSTGGTDVLTAWYVDTRLEFSIVKLSGTARTFRIWWRDGNGQAHSLDTSSGIYSANGWQHFAFAYEPPTGRLRIYRGGTHFQTLNLTAGGFPTTGDVWMGGRPLFADTMIGGLDEVSVYDRQLDVTEIWAIADAGPRGKVVAGKNLAPIVDAGPDLEVGTTGEVVELRGFAADDGLPFGGELRTQWRRVSGPSTVTFGNPTHVETTVQFGAPGIYTLELSADDGLMVSRDTLRAVVGRPDGNEVPLSGLRAHWPGDGNGNELISGFHADPVGPVSYVSGMSGTAFNLQNGLLVARTGGGLDVGSSPDGFSVEFWAWINSTGGTQVLAGWYGDNGVEFSITKLAGTARQLRIRWKDADGQVHFVDSLSGIYAFEGWQHWVVTYDNVAGRFRIFRNGLGYQTFQVEPGAVPTPGDFWMGGRPLFAEVFSGRLDEVSVYDRRLLPAEVAELHAAGSFGKPMPTINRAPVVFAGFEQEHLDTLSFTLDGYVRDDGLPVGSDLEIGWTQVDGPGVAEILRPDDANTDVHVDEFGSYRFRLAVSDGELLSHSEVLIHLRNSAPENLPPVVNAGTALAVVLPNTAVLAGTAYDPDDGPQPLFATWTRVTGPAEVMFADAHSMETTAAFSVPGMYLLRLSVTDGTGSAADHVEITVYPSNINQAPQVDAGSDLTVVRSNIVTLAGAASDDGVPGPLQVLWSRVSGPAPVLIESPNTARTRAQFPETGVYVLELRAFDGDKESSDTVQITVVEGVNQPPMVDAGPSLAIDLGEVALFHPVIEDDGLPDGHLTVSWSYVGGPGGATLIRTATGSAGATFSRVGEHRFRITVSDGEFVVSDEIMVAVTAANRVGPQVALIRPQADGERIRLGESFLLRAEATDSDGVVEAVSFRANGVAIATVTGSGIFQFQWAGMPERAYEIVAVARNEIGQTTESEPVWVEVAPVPPGVTLAAPGNGSLHRLHKPINLWASATGGAVISSVEFLAGDQVIAIAETMPFVADHVLAAAGPVELRARAETLSGEILESDPISITVVASSADAPLARIVSPLDGETVTAPVEVRGFVLGGALSSYELQVRSADGGPADWRTIETGVAPVGATDGSAHLGDFDPTLLRNGIYELRLRAVDPFGFSMASETVSVVVEGGMKVGHFQIAFEDLREPMAGIPIQIIRSYDSRGGVGNDFGPDWELNFRTVQVHANGPVGRGWEDYVVRVQAVTGIPIYGIRPRGKRVVSVVVGDEVQQFEAYSPTEQAFYNVYAASIAFRPIHGSVGQLMLKQGGNFPIDRVNGGVDITDFFNSVDPEEFVYTTPGGIRLEIERVFGLRKLTDRNENFVTFSSNGISHSGGETIPFIRDAAGRIIRIEDTEGAAITYGYDEYGYLESVTDRAGETVYFEYVAHPADPDGGRRLLETIIDPLGNRALAAGYDGDGRLIEQIDADSRAMTFTHDIPNRKHIITDRLGNATLHEYDLRGNVVRTVDPLGNETFREYDSRDNEIRTIDALGNLRERTYDALGNLTSETEFGRDAAGNPVAHTTSYSYDGFGNPLTLTDALGNVTGFTYDPRGNLLSQEDALGNLTLFTYDTIGNVTRMTDPEGNRTEFDYDARGNQTAMRIRDTDGLIVQETHFTFDSRGNQLTRTVGTFPSDPSGDDHSTTRYFYDAQSRLIRTIFPDGGESRITYDAAGRETERIDPLGRVTTFEYDLRGNRSQVIHPDGSITRSTFDAEDRLLTETDALGAVTTYEYDALGRQIATVYPDGTSTDTIYDGIGRIIATADERGNLTQFEYDDHCGCSNRRSRVIDALGNVTHYEYDAAGNQVAITDANGHTTRFEYDALNRSVRTLYPDGSMTETGYDTLGRRVSETDQAGRTTEFEYDAANRLVSIFQPSPAPGAPRPVTRYEYDVFGNRIAQIDALGRTTRYKFDKMNRRISRTLPLGERETYSHDLLGRLTATTDMNGYTTTFAYDSRDRLISRTADPSHPSLVLPHVAFRETFTYDATGRRLSARVFGNPLYGAAPLHAEGFIYDVRGRLVAKQTPHGTLTYDYDEAGNLTGVHSDSQAGLDLEYEYDFLNRLQAVLDHGAGEGALRHEYAYNPVGSLARITTAAGITQHYTYNSLNRLTSLAATNGGGQSLHSFTYTLNAAGHRTRIAESDGRTRDFVYDGLYRLTRETIAGDPNGYDGDLLYAHDLVGNRLSRVSTLPGVFSQTYGYDANDRLDSDTYDAAGNTLSSTLGSPPVSGGSDQYDFRHRLIRRTTASGTVIDLSYDADGNRIAKEVDGLLTVYLVDTNSLTGYAQVVEELQPDTSGTFLCPVAVYVYGHAPLTQSRLAGPGFGEWNHHYYLHEGQGTIWALADETGTITDRYWYEAFGIHLAEAGNTTNPNRYTGEQWDPDLGHYYLRARYYDPARARFWTMDPFEGFSSDPISLHKYLYAHANPVMYVDPSGNSILKEIGISMAIGAVVNTALTVVSQPSLFKEPSLADIGAQLALSAGEGALSGVFGGIGGRLALKLFPPLKNALLKGIASGAGGGATYQLAKELFAVLILGQPLEFKDRLGRVIVATAVGAGVGGVGFKFEPLVQRTRALAIRTPSGFTVSVSWIDITRFELSRTGAIGAGGTGALGSILEMWIYDVFEFR